MTENNEEQSDEKMMFQRFVAAADSDIRKYEGAIGRGNREEAAEALEELAQHALEAREEWMSIEIYFQDEPRQFAWRPVHPDEDFVRAIKQYLRIINDQLTRDDLPSAAAVVGTIRDLISKVAGSRETNDDEV